MMKLSLTWVLLATSLFFSAYTHAAVESEDTSTTKNSTHYRVSYTSKVEPLPLNHIHSWELYVETLDGKPVENATITIYGGMPMHKHDLPTQPVVTELGDGDYLVEGMKFSMLGTWKIWVQVQAGEFTDTVTFYIEL